jgi:hypothetical protein
VGPRHLRFVFQPTNMSSPMHCSGATNNGLNRLGYWIYSVEVSIFWTKVL